MADDLWVVSCYFNRAGFATKHANYERFIEGLGRCGVNYRVVECAFGEAEFSLAPSANVLQVRGRDVMWQKERLLNVAIGRLPDSCTKVAWVDCDVLFGDGEWAGRASRLLDEFPIVQPFDRVIRLPRGHVAYRGEGELWPGFVAVAQRHPNLMLGGDFARHGHTGFAWAARREVIERHGLYDACISGSGITWWRMHFVGIGLRLALGGFLGKARCRHIGRTLRNGAKGFITVYPHFIMLVRHLHERECKVGVIRAPQKVQTNSHFVLPQ